MSEALLAEISVALGMIGLIATFIAPIIFSGSQLYFEILDISRLNKDSETDRIEIKIFHDGKNIEDDVFLINSDIINTGRKDITYTDFVKDIQIYMDGTPEIISAEVSAPDGVDIQSDINGGSLFLKWAILKPGEKIELRLVIRSPGEHLKYSEISKSIHFEARLRDVKIGPGLRRFQTLVAPIVTSFVFMIIIGTTFYVLDRVGENHWVYNNMTEHAQYVIIDPIGPFRQSFRACKMNGDNALHICHNINFEDAKKMISLSGRQHVYFSTSLFQIALGLLLSIIYGFAGAFLLSMRRRLRRGIRTRI